MDKKDYTFNLVPGDTSKAFEELGPAGGCIVLLVALSIPFALSWLLAPITGVAAWKIFAILVLAKIWFV
jgi:hypothetical protein